MPAHQSPPQIGAAARARYAELTSDARRRELLAVAAIGVAIAAGASWLMGWQLGMAAGLWAAGAVLIYQWRTDRSTSWMETEARMTRLLAPLETHGYTVLADRSLPASLSHIDHLVIGPAGVVVVDSKSWRHRRLITGNRNRFHVGSVTGRTAVRSAAQESDRVREALTAEVGHPVEVTAVVAVHGTRVPYWRSPAVGGVPAVQAGRVRQWILDHDERLTTADVALLAEAADRLFPSYSTTP